MHKAEKEQVIVEAAAPTAEQSLEALAAEMEAVQAKACNIINSQPREGTLARTIYRVLFNTNRAYSLSRTAYLFT